MIGSASASGGTITTARPKAINLHPVVPWATR